MTGATMKKFVGIMCVVLGFAANASAASIVGTLNFGGTVTVTGTTIDWADQDGVPNLASMETSTGYFSAMDAGISPSYASSIDLVAPTQVMPNFLHDFKENPVDLPTEYDDLSFNLDDIVEPSAPPCDPNVAYVGNAQCSLGVFTLTQTTGGNLTISMDILGTFIDPSLGASTPATGIYTAQRTNEGINDILAIFGPGGAGTFTTSYSASITAVPEPATLLTFGAGTALLAAHRRRRAKKNNA